jgi:hypothetical protein
VVCLSIFEKFMIVFGLVVEGKTDLAVLDNILCGFFGDDNIEVTDLQPRRKDQDSFGNWLNVFKYCASPKLARDLQAVDYIVIQIDTDVSEDIGYDVPKFMANEEGHNIEKNIEQMIADVQARLIEAITPEIHQRYQSRIIFSICVDSLECWLLPLVYPSQSGKTKNCFKAFQRHLIERKKTRSKELDKELSKKNDKDLKNPKSFNFYDSLSSAYLDFDLLQECAKENPSFSVFIKNLIDMDIKE